MLLITFLQKVMCGHLVLNSTQNNLCVGVLLWELFVFCKRDPYDGIGGNLEVRKKALAGEDMSQFLDCNDMPEEIEEMKAECMSRNPETRPTFDNLRARLTKIQQKMQTGTFELVDLNHRTHWLGHY